MGRVPVEPGAYKEAAGCLKGLLGDESPEEAIRRARDGVTKEMLVNADLGAMVRRMPHRWMLQRTRDWNGDDSWVVYCGPYVGGAYGHTPEEALAAAGVRIEAQEAGSVRKPAHECPKARC